mmetsp:Transcript_52025/g.135454  ORF Transcript_52025/g.135454 Transcript_52025/m.135454 type:complete len:263 (+) Transcript_52025:98-886(+)
MCSARRRRREPEALWPLRRAHLAGSGTPRPPRSRARARPPCSSCPPPVRPARAGPGRRLAALAGGGAAAAGPGEGHGETGPPRQPEKPTGPSSVDGTLARPLRVGICERLLERRVGVRSHWRLQASHGQLARDVVRPGHARPAVLAVRHDAPAPLACRCLAGIAPAVHEGKVVVTISIPCLECPLAKRDLISGEREQHNLLRIFGQRQVMQKEVEVLEFVINGQHGMIYGTQALLEILARERHHFIIDATPPTAMLEGDFSD